MVIPKYRTKPNPFGICKICGNYVDALATHLKYSHNMTLQEYYMQFPETRRQAVDIWKSYGMHS